MTEISKEEKLHRIFEGLAEDALELSDKEVMEEAHAIFGEIKTNEIINDMRQIIRSKIEESRRINN